jgi:hypothetical protein
VAWPRNVGKQVRFSAYDHASPLLRAPLDLASLLCSSNMFHDNATYMARFRKCPPTKNGLLIGAATIAETFGVHAKTIHRWIRLEGFPAARLPTGHVCTSLTLIDLWLLGRLKQPTLDNAALARAVAEVLSASSQPWPPNNAATGSVAGAMASPAHATRSAACPPAEGDRGR